MATDESAKTKKRNIDSEDVEFIYPHEADPRRHVAGGQGIYLDQVEREKAEIARAKVEGRRPDLKNPPAAAGTPLMSKAAFLNAGGSYVPVEDLPVVTQPVVKD
jgi:hypothetical protein